MSNVLPRGWAKVTLGEVVEVRDFEREPINSRQRAERIAGKSHDELFPYYGATGQVGLIDGYRSEGEQVLLGEDGAPFLDPHRDKAYIVTGRYWVNNHAHVLSGIEGVMSNRLLAHQLNAADYRDFVTGSTRLKLTSAAMKRIPLLLPPPAEQNRIVEKLEELLSDLDAGVAELKAAQRKLAQYRQSLLKAAVDGTLTADWRAAHGAPQETGAELLQRILTERRARWEQKQLAKFAEQGKTPPKGWQAKYSEPVAPDLTDLPLLPEGWTWASTDQLATSVRNGLSQKPEQEPVGYPILRINAVRAMSVNLDEVRYLPISAGEAEHYILNDGDLLATRYNGSVDLLGVVGVVRGLSRATVHPDKLIRIQPVLDEYLADWIEAAAFTGSSRAHVLSRVKTTAGQTGISGDDLKRMPIPLPSTEEQQAILERLGSGLSAHKQQESAIDYVLKQAAGQRKNLLKAAFCGQLVPQDPNDEPAGELLARIRAARERSPAPRGRRRAGSNPAPATNPLTPTRRGRKAKAGA